MASNPCPRQRAARAAAQILEETEAMPSLPAADDGNDVHFVEVLRPAREGNDLKRVPEIEIKLESSEEEEEPSEEGSAHSAPQRRKSRGKGGREEAGLRPTRKRKSTSEVWQFFSRDSANVCRAVCGLCQMSVSRGKLGGNFGTTALKRHLECKHPLEWGHRKSMQRAELEEEEEETLEEEEEAGPDLTFVSSQGPSYEIIVSSEEEEEEPGGGKRRKPEDGGRDDNLPSQTVTIPDYSAVPPGARRRKSISAVWQFFCLDPGNICRAICTLCQASVSRGKMGGHFGTSALMRHLEGKHPLEWGRGKFNKLNVASAVEDEDDEEDSFMYPEVPYVGGLAGADLSLYPDMTDAASHAHYSAEREEPTPPCPRKYTPNHPRAQAWNRHITELLCEAALPFSLVGSKAFVKFMGRADPQYSAPSKSFFSRKAVPRLHQAVCEKMVGELRRSSCPHIHITAHMWNGDLSAHHLSLTAHWSVPAPEAPPRRNHAVLCIKRFPKEFSDVNLQQEVSRQLNLWLTSNQLSPGFFISNRDFNLLQALRGAGVTYVPCFAQSLNLLVKDFLHSNRYIAGMLAVARGVCSHFLHSARARRILAELQYQNNLPRQPLKAESAPHWTSTFYMLQRLLEQQKAVQAYFLMHKVEAADVLLSPGHWNLMLSLVDLLQPFEMATREVNSNASCLSQVLPELRYLHIFLKKIRGHFESSGDASGVVIADSLALKLSTDYGVHEMFQKEEYVLATLMDPRFKGRIEAILPPDSDIDHWKQVLVRKVKEAMSPPGQFRGRAEPEAFPAKMVDLEAGGPPWRRSSEAAPFIHKEKSLIEHLESVGLLASKSTGASLSTENHSACVMVERYLQDNKTIGAKDDPLTYWQKKTWVWPALAKMAVLYLTCPSSSICAERVFSSSPLCLDGSEGAEQATCLRSNLENFPDYDPPPLIYSSDNEAEQSDSDEGL